MALDVEKVKETEHEIRLLCDGRIYRWAKEEGMTEGQMVEETRRLAALVEVED